jgi:hypothetical protein
MRVEMPLERFLEIYRLVALGKLIQGLVHNLNGPLQNLGMDMEMMEHTLRSEKRLPKEYSEGFLGRLQRMEAEFDQISRLIKSSSMRIDMEGDFLPHGNLKGLLEEEISFLNCNLYFKHNVRKEIHLSEDFTHVDGLSHDLQYALCWFIQAVVEGMDSGNGRVLHLSARKAPSALEISLCIDGEMVGRYYKDGLQGDLPAEGSLKVEDGIGMAFPLSFLRLHGVSSVCRREPQRVEFTLTIPYPPG